MLLHSHILPSCVQSAGRALIYSSTGYRHPVAVEISQCYTHTTLHPHTNSTVCVELHITCTAAPYRSEENEPAVAEALAILSDAVSHRKILSTGRERHRAHTCTILVCRPFENGTPASVKRERERKREREIHTWPISIPPWVSSTDPSVYTCTRADP